MTVCLCRNLGQKPWLVTLVGNPFRKQASQAIEVGVFEGGGTKGDWHHESVSVYTWGLLLASENRGGAQKRQFKDKIEVGRQIEIVAKRRGRSSSLRRF